MPLTTAICDCPPLTTELRLKLSPGAHAPAKPQISSGGGKTGICTKRLDKRRPSPRRKKLAGSSHVMVAVPEVTAMGSARAV
jgi:hypothetical protein